MRVSAAVASEGCGPCRPRWYGPSALEPLDAADQGLLTQCGRCLRVKGGDYVE